MSNNSENNIKREMLTEYEEQIDLVFNSFNEKKIDQEHLKNSLNWIKKVWKYSRIDIKNRGNVSNNIRFFERDTRYDKDLSIETPDWFQDDKGKGAKIEFQGRKKYLHFQCLNDGHLEIAVRGLDYRNLNNERKPVSINCIKLLLNNKEFISNDIRISHDEPFIFSKRCHNLERFNIAIETKTIYYYYPKLDTFFNNPDIKALKADYDEIKKYIGSQKAALQNNIINFNVTSKEERVEIPKTNVAIFGSCVSVDPFRNCYNNYQKDFNKMYEHQRSTMISLMNPKVEYAEEDIKYLINAPDKLFIDSDIRRDFEKEIFKHLDNIDYLVINVVHDIRWGVLAYEDTYITRSDYIYKTNFYKNNEAKLRPITIFNNEQEYFELWKNNCDKFFEYLSKNYPNMKIILQKIELLDHYIKFDGSYGFRQDFQDQAQKLNPYFNKLEQYIEDNHNVIVIPFPSDTCLDEGNIWGLYSTHYSRSYYENVFNKIRCHVLEDKLRDVKN